MAVSSYEWIDNHTDVMHAMIFYDFRLPETYHISACILLIIVVSFWFVCLLVIMVMEICIVPFSISSRRKAHNCQNCEKMVIFIPLPWKFQSVCLFQAFFFFFLWAYEILGQFGERYFVN